jgi:hypothetical protein
MDDRLERALTALDALHAEDPENVVVDGEAVPAELAYARRMTAALARLTESPSEALSIAVRAQHLCRWRMPRSAYPEGKAGYLKWRTEQARQHAALAASVLRDVGYDDALIARVEALIRKRELTRDAEAQTLEDAACLVFLAHHIDDFAEGRDDAQLVDILQKTWRKMGDAGRARALELPLSERVRALVARALQG